MPSYYVPILLGSVRRGRQSPKVAKFLMSRLGRYPSAETEILDALDFDFPVMEERFHNREDPPPRMAELASKIERADGLLLVSPEYNHGYPGVVKNLLDYFYPEYRRKPVGIVTVSAGSFGGLRALEQLRPVFLALGDTASPLARRRAAVGLRI